MWFRRRTLVWLAGPAVGAALLVGSLSPVGLNREVLPPPAIEALNACAAWLAPPVPLAADDSVAAPLAARPRLRLITAARPSDWVMVDLATVQPAYADHSIRDWRIAHLAASGRRKLCGSGRFQLWSPQGW